MTRIDSISISSGSHGSNGRSYAHVRRRFVDAITIEIEIEVYGPAGGGGGRLYVRDLDAVKALHEVTGLLLSRPEGGSR